VLRIPVPAYYKAGAQGSKECDVVSGRNNMAWGAIERRYRQGPRTDIKADGGCLQGF